MAITEYVEPKDMKIEKSSRKTNFCGVEFWDGDRGFVAHVADDSFQVIVPTSEFGENNTALNNTRETRDELISAVNHFCAVKQIYYADTFKEIVMWTLENVKD